MGVEYTIKNKNMKPPCINAFIHKEMIKVVPCVTNKKNRIIKI